MKGVTILGSTGTIGVNTLDVIARHPQQFRVIALTANTQVDRLAQQCRQFHPQYAVMADAQAAEKLRQQLHHVAPDIQVLSGIDAMEQIVGLPETDFVMAAIVGAIGLQPTLAAARAGKRILLANKEALVMSGRIFMDEIRKNHAELLPIDSEHNAIFQCLPIDYTTSPQRGGVKRLWLTGSGGPFRTIPLEQLATVTPEQAVAHPNWNMGKKISVDSATMMNKGLELIEACWLFDVVPQQIEVVIHPQSIVHSMVEYCDGSMLAQLGQPDMRTPIAHALAWPTRIESGVTSLSLAALAKLEFSSPEIKRYPCLGLAYQAMQRGDTASTLLNAANEVAVKAFLDRQIGFNDIACAVEHVLEQISIKTIISLDSVLEADQQARWEAGRYINQRAYRRGTGSA